jgi:hypothetical protein
MSLWYKIIRAHDRMWCNRRIPLARRVEACVILHRLAVKHAE